MTFSFHIIIKRLTKALLSIGLLLSLILYPFGNNAYAARYSMSGDYVKDTVTVAHDLKEIISMSDESENNKANNTETVALITDYISRYRNRSQVNGTISFTTMQTALNAMAGHYKTFANRPLPDALKERLNKELSKAEDLVTRDS